MRPVDLYVRLVDGDPHEGHFHAQFSHDGREWVDCNLWWSDVPDLPEDTREVLREIESMSVMDERGEAQMKRQTGGK